MTELTTFGARLRQARRLMSARTGLDVRQGEIADALEVTQTAVSNWEADRTEPSFATVAALAKFLGVDAGWLAFGESPRPAESQPRSRQMPITKNEPPAKRRKANGGR